MVDAHCKWPEVIGPMKTTADPTINAMRNIFARYGLLTQVLSDNGPPFQSAEYEEFLRQNGIQRILVSPYHPSSNGLDERFGQTFKYAMESSADDPASSIQRRDQNFLLSYRSTPHGTTNSSPAKLLLQRELRTRLSLVTPDIGSRVASKQDKMKSNHDKFAKYRDSCRRLCSRTWPPIGTQVASWYCRTSNITCFLSSPAERWTELEETPLVLLWLNPALSKLHLINLLKALLLLVPTAVHPPPWRIRVSGVAKHTYSSHPFSASVQTCY